MGQRTVSSACRAASPHHRKTNLRDDTVEVVALSLRLVAVGLLGAIGWVHLHLWQEAYRHIPTIGPLFLAAAVSALIFGVGLLGRPSRLIGLLGFGTVIGILAGFIVSVNVGLFGFTESLTAPFAVESIVLEIAAAVTLVAWTAMDLLAESRALNENRLGRTAGLGFESPHVCSSFALRPSMTASNPNSKSSSLENRPERVTRSNVVPGDDVARVSAIASRLI
jgi:hypothetical protein